MTTNRRLRIATFALVLTAFAVGCQQEAADVGSPAEPAAPEAEQPSFVVDGWECLDVEACFGLEVGRTSTFERRVGVRVETEIHTLADRVPRAPRADAAPTAHTFVDLAGEPRYEVSLNGTLSLEVRGELMESIHVPVTAGDEFAIDDGKGNDVTMTVLETDATWSSAAGEFSPCMVHEARFENHEHPDRRGLRVTTTMCQGIGQVARTIELPSLPLPVEFTLLGHEGLPDEEGDRG